MDTAKLGRNIGRLGKATVIVSSITLAGAMLGVGAAERRKLSAKKGTTWMFIGSLVGLVAGLGIYFSLCHSCNMKAPKAKANS